MQQTVTAKLQIIVSRDDIQVMKDTMLAYCAACNYVSDYVFSTHDMSLASVQKHTYRHVRSAYGLRSQMATSCVRTVVAKYKTILANQKEWIQPKFHELQLDLVWNRDYSISRDMNTFSVNTLKGRIHVPFFKNGYGRYLAPGCTFGTAKLVYVKGKFYLHVPVTYEIGEPDETAVSNVIGVDRGIRFIATAYDSSGRTTFYSGKAVSRKRAHYKAVRKSLQRVGTPSARRRLKAIGSRENRFVRDVNHCVSKALVDSNPKGTLFVMENLTGIRGATEKVSVKDRYVVVSWPYYDLEQKLMYKAMRNEQSVLLVDPAYTSQKCPKCGHTAKSNRDRKNHSFCCKKCGYKSNDDRAGAMNLQQIGSDYIKIVACQ